MCNFTTRTFFNREMSPSVHETRRCLGSRSRLDNIYIYIVPPSGIEQQCLNRKAHSLVIIQTRKFCTYIKYKAYDNYFLIDVLRHVWFFFSDLLPSSLCSVGLNEHERFFIPVCAPCLNIVEEFLAFCYSTHELFPSE